MAGFSIDPSDPLYPNPEVDNMVRAIYAIIFGTFSLIAGYWWAISIEEVKTLQAHVAAAGGSPITSDVQMYIANPGIVFILVGFLFNIIIIFASGSDIAVGLGIAIVVGFIAQTSATGGETARLIQKYHQSATFVERMPGEKSQLADDVDFVNKHERDLKSSTYVSPLDMVTRQLAITPLRVGTPSKREDLQTILESLAS